MRYVPRYVFRAQADIVHLESGTRLSAITNELSLFGCSLDASPDFQEGANLRIQLRYDGLEVIVFGRVVYAKPDLGIGVAFTSVESRDERVLCGWLAQLMKQESSV